MKKLEGGGTSLKNFPTPLFGTRKKFKKGRKYKQKKKIDPNNLKIDFKVAEIR